MINTVKRRNSKTNQFFVLHSARSVCCSLAKHRLLDLLLLEKLLVIVNLPFPYMCECVCACVFLPFVSLVGAACASMGSLNFKLFDFSNGTRSDG